MSQLACEAAPKRKPMLDQFPSLAQYICPVGVSFTEKFIKPTCHIFLLQTDTEILEYTKKICLQLFFNGIDVKLQDTQQGKPIQESAVPQLVSESHCPYVVSISNDNYLAGTLDMYIDERSSSICSDDLVSLIRFSWERKVIEFHSTSPRPFRVEELWQTRNPPSLKVVPDVLLAHMTERQLAPLVDKFTDKDASLIGGRMQFFRANLTHFLKAKEMRRPEPARPLFVAPARHAQPGSFFAAPAQSFDVRAGPYFPAPAPAQASFTRARATKLRAAHDTLPRVEESNLFSVARDLQKDLQAARAQVLSLPLQKPFTSWVGPGSLTGSFVGAGSCRVMNTSPLFRPWKRVPQKVFQVTVTLFFREFFLAVLDKWLGEVEALLTRFSRPVPRAEPARTPGAFLARALGTSDHAAGLTQFAQAVAAAHAAPGGVEDLTRLCSFLSSASQAVQRQLDERIDRRLLAQQVATDAAAQRAVNAALYSAPASGALRNTSS
eukprot:gnl/Chilomastix_cuspidata/1393.p1 GENE.gnl/Chilomastix_cuspidata/1393~~gnl/Chilomastix_cuspidata/1393.p1  ORF type:complete len:493 (+),score=170.69 gnl/Chilomastix_cuspidata/1393:89-1567(+)